jgi:hypothetical protein
VTAFCRLDGCNWSHASNDSRILNSHLDSHNAKAAEVHQLDGPAFLIAFLNYVKGLPVGTEFTTADIHGHVPAPPDHHWWGKAQREAARLGLCAQVATQTSNLATTKDSLVKRWRRVAEAQRVAS